MNLKRIIIVIFLLAIVGLGASWYYYKKELPKIVAEAVVNDEYDDYPSIMPEKVVRTIEASKKEVNKRVDKVIKTTKTAGITVEQLIQGIDEVKEEDARKMTKVLLQTEIISVEQVFDMGVKHLQIDAFDPELLREAFVANVEMQHIKRGLKYIESNDLLNTMGADMARDIAKAVIRAKEEKIREKANIVD